MNKLFSWFTKFSSDTKSPTIATPFVKWAGGKRGIMKTLIARLPDSFETYWEPFAGGAALFFKLADSGKITNAYLSDNNFDLIIAYNVIKHNPKPLIRQLRKHAVRHNRSYYYEIRAQHTLQNPIEIAARFIYLNKTCFNGLHRVNTRGEFNVPIGNNTNPDIVAENNLMACKNVLAMAIIEHREFDTIEPRNKDFVYFDPPYHPTPNSSFTKYTKQDFTEKDQVRLRDFIVDLSKQGIKIMLSNSNVPFIHELYKDFQILMIQAPRVINCKPSQRNAVNELLITNY